MFERLNLYWRWLRIKRVKARRYVQVELPSFSRVSEESVINVARGGGLIPAMAGEMEPER